MLKKEAEKGDTESQKNAAIIRDYKQICSQLSERLDKEHALNATILNEYKVTNISLMIRGKRTLIKDDWRG